MSATIELAKALIAKNSISPNDAGCQDLIISRLMKYNFSIEKLHFGDVDNLWARFGDQNPLIVFAGHTDVVPPGDEKTWQFPPFSPTIHNDKLYGRGSADMKGALAAMITAVENFLTQHPEPRGSIAFLITSDEEGKALDGTKKVVEHLSARKETIDYCIVGEATSEQKLGDTIKIGRRGSLSGKLKIFGKQGHIAYPHLALNPIHQTIPFLQNLLQQQWDEGYDFFQPTQLQISNIQAGIGVDNVIPAELRLNFNFRYNPAITAEELQDRIVKLLQYYELNYEITWQHSGKPFFSKPGKLAAICQEAVKEVTEIEAKLSTSGGTSDARFIIQTNCEIAELGVLNQTAHQCNEHVAIADLENLTNIYQRILEKVLGK